MMTGKKIAIVLTGAVAMVFGLAGPAGAQSTPVAHWKLDEAAGTSGSDSVADSAGSYPGTPLGAGEPVFGGAGATSGTGTSASFDGANDYIEIPYAAALHPITGFTVTVWAKSAALDGTYDCVVGTRPSGSSTTGYILYRDEMNEWSFYLGRADGTWWQTSYGGGPDATTDWTHLAIVYDSAATGSEMKLYVNGSEAISTSAPNYDPGNSTTYIGKNGAGFPFKGDIDDVRLFDVALTESQIQSIMNTAATPGTLIYGK